MSRNAVSAWITGINEPRLAYVRLFAMRTGTPLEWLLTGQVTQNAPGPDDGTEGVSDGVRSKGLEPPTF